MADTESLGEAGVQFLEGIAARPSDERQVRIPMITDPRGIDFCHYQRLRQTDLMASLEQRAIDAFEAMGILMTNTCINYQTIMPPVRGEHLAFGDTGVVIYCNSVLGAYSNFEGGPSALAAGLTGRTPRYGLHLDRNRRATRRFHVDFEPRFLSDWGALGGIIGARAGSYWEVPVIEGIHAQPGSDEMKHMGAAMASFGSVPLFHVVGVTPEAPTLEAVCEPHSLVTENVGTAEVETFFSRYGGKGEKVDVVVFSAPQLSLLEMQSLAALLDGKRLHPGTSLLAATSPVVAADARRLGLVERIEASGALVLEGMCFYQSYAREMGEANGWKRLMTNSVKLANIIGGYGYEPTLSNMENCVASAIAGEIV
jgi:predicted aconitase